MSDEETIAVYDAKATEYADLIEREAEADPYLQSFLEACVPGGRLLDLGCGPGVSAGQMAAAGFDVDATDASGEMVALAAQQAGVTAWQATFDDISGEAVYDGIWANFSLLHAARADMPRHLKALRTALRPGGVFHIGLKLGDGAKRDGIGRQYTYYTEAELDAALMAAGFTPTFRDFGSSRGLDGVMAEWIVMRADA